MTLSKKAFEPGGFATPDTRASSILRDVNASGSSIPELPPGTAYKAARFVASMAIDAEDCRELLGMLGLTATQGLSMGDAA